MLIPQIIPKKTGSKPQNIPSLTSGTPSLALATSNLRFLLAANPECLNCARFWLWANLNVGFAFESFANQKNYANLVAYLVDSKR